MKYTSHIVDVFSSTPFGGNQLAALPIEGGSARTLVRGACILHAVGPIPESCGNGNIMVIIMNL